jgi:hypothetical protein
MITKLFEEQFYKTIQVGYNIKEDVNIYINPSMSELKNIKGGNIRGMLDGENLYCWDAFKATHYDIYYTLGINGIAFEFVLAHNKVYVQYGTKKDKLIVKNNKQLNKIFPDGFNTDYL